VQAVKSLAIAVCCILLSTAARSSVKVERTVPHECTQFLRIAVTLDGKPLSDVKLAFHKGFGSDGSTPLFILSTNDDGIASAPKLAPGNYRIDASFNGIRSIVFDEPVATNLLLHAAAKLEISTVPMDLMKSARELWHANKMFDEQLEAASGLPVHDRIRTFQETIVDPTGAKVASAKTWVVQRTFQGWGIVLQSMSDANGQFSRQLNDGSYIAICSLPGFRTAIVPFEVTKNGTEDLRIVLQIGASSE
jgi:hypothetical protein